MSSECLCSDQRLKRLLLSTVEFHSFIILNERGDKGKRSQNWDLSLNSVPCLFSFSTLAVVNRGKGIGQWLLGNVSRTFLAVRSVAGILIRGQRSY